MTDQIYNSEYKTQSDDPAPLGRYELMKKVDGLEKIVADFEETLLSVEDYSAKRIAQLEAEVKRLKALHHDIYEVYAGSEGLPCETISESYLCVLIRKMVALAVEGKS